MDIQPTSAPDPFLNAATTAVPATAPEGTLGGIADRLGMSAAALQSALRDGHSLAGLAEQQGVPRESVASFIQAQISQAREATGQPPLDQAALERTVERALDRGRRPPASAGDEDPESEAVAVGTYTSSARTVLAGARTSSTISLLA